jgi:hypothetical protein
MYREDRNEPSLSNIKEKRFVLTISSGKLNSTLRFSAFWLSGSVLVVKLKIAQLTENMFS